MAKKTGKSEIAVATSEEALNFIQEMQEKFKKRPSSAQERQVLREYLGKFEKEKLRSVARRVLMDIVQGPARSQITGDPYPEPPAPPQPHQESRTPAKTRSVRPKATLRPAGRRATVTAKSKVARARRKPAKR
jgi:hypothetical protein